MNRSYRENHDNRIFKPATLSHNITPDIAGCCSSMFYY